MRVCGCVRFPIVLPQAIAQASVAGTSAASHSSPMLPRSPRRRAPRRPSNASSAGLPMGASPSPVPSDGSGSLDISANRPTSHSLPGPIQLPTHRHISAGSPGVAQNSRRRSLDSHNPSSTRSAPNGSISARPDTSAVMRPSQLGAQPVRTLDSDDMDNLDDRTLEAQAADRADRKLQELDSDNEDQLSSGPGNDDTDPADMREFPPAPLVIRRTYSMSGQEISLTPEDRRSVGTPVSLFNLGQSASSPDTLSAGKHKASLSSVTPARPRFQTAVATPPAPSDRMTAHRILRSMSGGAALLGDRGSPASSGISSPTGDASVVRRHVAPLQLRSQVSSPSMSPAHLPVAPVNSSPHHQNGAQGARPASIPPLRRAGSDGVTASTINSGASTPIPAIRKSQSARLHHPALTDISGKRSFFPSPESATNSPTPHAEGRTIHRYDSPAAASDTGLHHHDTHARQHHLSMDEDSDDEWIIDSKPVAAAANGAQHHERTIRNADDAIDDYRNSGGAPGARPGRSRGRAMTSHLPLHRSASQHVGRRSRDVDSDAEDDVLSRTVGSGGRGGGAAGGDGTGTTADSVQSSESDAVMDRINAQNGRQRAKTGAAPLRRAETMSSRPKSGNFSPGFGSMTPGGMGGDRSRRSSGVSSMHRAASSGAYSPSMMGDDDAESIDSYSRNSGDLLGRHASSTGDGNWAEPTHQKPGMDDLTHAVMEEFLRSVPLFQQLTTSQFGKLARRVTHVSFKAGDIIVLQGEPGNEMYIVESGSISVRINHSGLPRPAGPPRLHRQRVGTVPGRTKENDVKRVYNMLDPLYSAGLRWEDLGAMVHRYGQAEFFGERSLLNNDPRAATCIAEEDVRCVGVSRSLVDSVLSNLHSLLGDAEQAYGRNDPEALSLSKHVKQFRDVVLRSNDLELLSIMSAFSPELNVDDVIERIVAGTYQIFNVDRVGLFLVNRHTNPMSLRLKVSKDARGVDCKMEGIAGSVAMTGEVVNLEDVYLDERFNPEFDRRTNYRTKTMLAVPIHRDGLAYAPRDRDGVPEPALAVIQLINKKGDKPFDRNDLRLLQAVAAHLGQTLMKMNMEMSLDEGQSFIPIWKSTKPFHVTIAGIHAVNVPPKKRFGFSKSGSARITVTAELYHGKEHLAAPQVSSEFKPEVRKELISQDGKIKPNLKADSDHRETLTFDIPICHLPRASRIIFTVTANGTPVAWAGCPLFKFDKQLRAGVMTLKLWNGECPTPTVTSLANEFGEAAPELYLQFPEFSKPVIFTDHGQNDSVKDISVHKEQARGDLTPQLQRLAYSDPLYHLTEEERQLMWRERYRLTWFPSALPKFLLSVDWASRDSVQEAYRLLHIWEPPTPLEALQLLDAQFPDPKVRAFAVLCLERLKDSELRQYMLQLTQVLKYEAFHDSALSRFLVRRALMNTKLLGNSFFWLLKAEMHIKDVQARYAVMLQQYLINCGSHRAHLGHQAFVMKRLEQVSEKVKQEKSKRDQVRVARECLADIQFPDRFQLPLSPATTKHEDTGAPREWQGVIVDECRVMSSKKLPLWLVFQPADDDCEPL